VDLVEAGVVTGRRKTRHRDRIVASYCLGTRPCARDASPTRVARTQSGAIIDGPSGWLGGVGHCART
jgi:hypothetical protein